MAQRRRPQRDVRGARKAARRDGRTCFRQNDGPRVYSLSEPAFAERIEVHEAATLSAAAKLVEILASGEPALSEVERSSRAGGHAAPPASVRSTNMNPYVITAAVSYLLGSIPFGYLLVRIFKGEDVRASGSGTIGATNVPRKSPPPGFATLFLDPPNGLPPVLLAPRLYIAPHH